MKNLGIGGSTGTGWTKRLGWDGSGRFRRSQKFKDRRLGWDGSDGTVSALAVEEALRKDRGSRVEKETLKKERRGGKRSRLSDRRLN